MTHVECRFLAAGPGARSSDRGAAGRRRGADHHPEGAEHVTTDAPIVNSVQLSQYRRHPAGDAAGQQQRPRHLDIDQAVSDVSTTTTSTINSPTITAAPHRQLGRRAGRRDHRARRAHPEQSDQGRTASRCSPTSLIGSLFGQTTNTAGRHGALVLLTPRIIRNGAGRARHDRRTARPHDGREAARQKVH